MKTVTKTAAIAALFAVAAATAPQALAGECAASAGKTAYTANRPVEKDIVDTAVGAGNFTTLAAALKAAGLVDALKGEGPFTVFAPTDEAFAKLPKGTVESLLKDKEKLTAILTYHVVPGKVTAKDVVGLKSAKTLQGGELKIDAKDGVKINEAKVIQPDVMAGNGVIHVIDSVLLPN